MIFYLMHGRKVSVFILALCTCFQMATCVQSLQQLGLPLLRLGIFLGVMSQKNCPENIAGSEDTSGPGAAPCLAATPACNDSQLFGNTTNLDIIIIWISDVCLI